MDPYLKLQIQIRSTKMQQQRLTSQQIINPRTPLLIPNRMDHQANRAGANRIKSMKRPSIRCGGFRPRYSVPDPPGSTRQEKKSTENHPAGRRIEFVPDGERRLESRGRREGSVGKSYPLLLLSSSWPRPDRACDGEEQPRRGGQRLKR